MDLTFLWKDGESQISNCPALYETEGGYVVQGKMLGLKRDDRLGFVVYGKPVRDPVDQAQLRDLASDEDAVWVSAADLADAAIRDDAALRDPAPGETAVWVPANVLDLSRTPVEA